MSLKPAKVQFNGGELSPWLEARYDIAKFDKTAKLCRNFIPMAEGSLKRRGGSRFIALVPEDEGVKFEIKTIPVEAEVFINKSKMNSITVARGEWVEYEVKMDGYTPVCGKKFVDSDMEIEVSLVSFEKMCSLTINPVPEDAVVKIEGYQRNKGEFFENSEVFYIVLKDGYIAQSDVIKLSEDMVIDVVLEEDKTDEYDGSYGDFGKPEAMISCSAVGDMKKLRKCILLRFENGYLPIVFDANKIVPKVEDIDWSLFIYIDKDGADCVVNKDGKYLLSYMKQNSVGLYYYNLDGKIIMAIDTLSQKVVGWQIDEEGKYASYYKTYNGTVSGKFIKIYYKNELVLTLEGRN